MNDKKNLLVSFSGGETSAYMAQWLLLNKSNEYNMVFVFANTGQEDYETIRFIRRCELFFNIKVHYLELVVNFGYRKGSSHKEVESYNLKMDGSLFEEMVKKYGIPNASYPHCTRELKLNPIKSFAKKYFNNTPYFTAVGIREDEIDRVNNNHEKEGIIYPLISMRPMTKQKINFWWSQQPFRLELKGYQGNCITCWKKSDKKLFKIAQENKFALNVFGQIESKYGEFIPESRLKKMQEKGEQPKLPITFFRKNRSAYDIFMESKKFNGHVIDDHLENDDTESCDIYSGCGD